MSIEKEVFPFMAKEGQLHMMPLNGFWADVGQPKDFLTGMALNLTSYSKLKPEKLTKTVIESQIIGNVLIDPTAKIGKNCKIGPNVVIGAKCVVGDGVRLNNAVIMSNCSIKDVTLLKIYHDRIQ